MSRPDDVEIDLVDERGERWIGLATLDPPLVHGFLGTEHDERSHRVTGTVLGRRTDPVDTGERVVRALTPPPLRGLHQQVAGLVVAPWATLSLHAGPLAVDVRFVGDGWRADGDVRLHPDPTPWLRAFLDETARRLSAHAPVPGSVATAWEVARLRLVLGEWHGATAAVRRGIELLAAAPARGTERSAASRLVTILDAFPECRGAAADLRATLA